MSTELRVEPKGICELLGGTERPESALPSLRIPEYQRPYAWTADIALRLFDDLTTAVGPTGATWSDTWNALKQESSVPTDQRPRYVIGTLILHQPDKDSDVRNVVDGQQRLLTLLMMKQELVNPSTSPTPSGQSASETPARSVRQALRIRFQTLDSQERRACWNVIAHRAEMVVITTHDLDEAFSIFDSQNTRGRSLDPHDLLKAFHLREMRKNSEAERAAAIERWEKTDPDDLRRLFGRYLYRIARWSSGESAKNFTEHDIDIFKGITPSNAPTPIQQYHAAAQAMLPAIQKWETTAHRDTESRQLQLQHARFRLDEPIIAGDPFFEMVDFFLQELRRLKTAAVPSDVPQHVDELERHQETTSWKSIFGITIDTDSLSVAPGRATMLYVSELYLGAMLYAVNRFGEAAIHELGPLLRRWAFYPRVAQYAVREVTIDIRASAGDSVFRVIRNSHHMEKLLRLPVDLPTDPARSGNGQEARSLILREAGLNPQLQTGETEQSR